MSVCWARHVHLSRVCPTATLNTEHRTPSLASRECVHQPKRPRLGPRGILAIKASLLLHPQVPPLQEQESSCHRIREFRDQESILGPGAPRQRPRNHRTEQVLEWLFISHEQPKPTQSRVSCVFIYSRFSSIVLVSFFFFWLGEGWGSLGQRVKLVTSQFLPCLASLVCVRSLYLYLHTV